MKIELDVNHLEETLSLDIASSDMYPVPRGSSI